MKKRKKRAYKPVDQSIDKLVEFRVVLRTNAPDHKIDAFSERFKNEVHLQYGSTVESIERVGGRLIKPTNKVPLPDVGTFHVGLPGEQREE